MSKIKLENLLDLYEKEGIINNKLKNRKSNIEDYLDDIDNKKVEELGTDDANIHLTYQRGGDVLSEKIANTKYYINLLYLAHKILIHILVFIILFILFFKMVNK